MSLAVVYVTFPDQETARDVARQVVEQRVAACATFWAGGTIYRWDGEIEAGDETMALFKTTPDRVDALKEAIERTHPYDVPCILPLASQAPNEAYQAWVQDETRAAEQKG